MLAVGIDAPTFSLPDGAGQTHHLTEELARGPIILAFFKADCATCQLTFPYLEAIHQGYRGANWQLWGICQHPPRAAAWFARTTGTSFPLLIDAAGFPVSHLYDPPATPTIFLLDPRGMIQASFYGFEKGKLNALAGQLADLLGHEKLIIAPPDDGKPSFRPG